MWNTLFLPIEEDDDELANTKTNENIQKQPTSINKLNSTGKVENFHGHVNLDLQCVNLDLDYL